MDKVTQCGANFILIMVITNSIFIPGEGQDTFFGEYCAHEEFKPNCGAHSVVMIKNAHYGRMKQGVCKVKNMGFLGCSKDVSSVTHSMCSGRSSCSVQIPNAAFDATRPCSEQLISYLAIEYVCQPVVSSPSTSCQICDSINITAPAGYISSSIAIEKGCGKTNCPWLLQAEPGQKIDFTLYDYSTISSRKPSFPCETYAIIKEPKLKKGISICGSQSQKSHVFRSIGHIAKLSVMNFKKANFLIYYEFVGCPDIITEKILFTRNGNDAVVKCLDSDEEYKIQCKQSSWSNIESILCLVNDPQSISYKEKYTFPISPEIFVLLISSICFLFGAIVMVSGVWCFCKKPVSNTSTQAPKKPSKDTELYDIVYNAPVRHPGRDLRFKEDLNDVMMVQSFPRMSTKKITRQPSCVYEDTPVYEVLPVYEVPPGFQNGDDDYQDYQDYQMP